MRIVNLTEFLTMPVGTVFCKYQPCMFDDIQIFTGRSTVSESSIDFNFFDLFDVDGTDSREYIEVLLEAEKTGKSFKLDFSATDNDGLFEDNQLFAVFEKEDIEGMIKVLQNSLAGKIEISDD